MSIEATHEPFPTAARNAPPRRQVDSATQSAQQRAKPLVQAVIIQRLILKDIENPKTTAAIRAQAARAWVDLEERKRILKMRPLPKAVDSEEFKARRSGKTTANEVSFLDIPTLDTPPESPA